jgi:hypothetical protein
MFQNLVIVCNALENQNMKVANKSLNNVAKFKYLGMTVRVAYKVRGMLSTVEVT